MRITLAIFPAVFLFSLQAIADDDAPNMPTLTVQDRALLDSAVGNPDESLLFRIAGRLGTQKLITAFYQGTRAERLVALDAAAYVEESSDILPSLIALMGASERRTAERAAASVSSILYDPEQVERCIVEMIPNQAVALMSQLQVLAMDGRLNADVRVIAVTSWERLVKIAKMSDFKWSAPLLNDAETSVRRAVIGLQRVPLSDDLLMTFAKIANDDGDRVAKGLSASMLCENALAHGVKDPSEDLTALLKVTVQDAAIPLDMQAGIFSCLTQFSPDGRRLKIIEAALSSKNPEVIKLIQNMKLK
jgi:hypothetical protein